MVSLTVKTKEDIINAVAEGGSLKAALEDFNLKYLDYAEYLEQDSEFMDLVNQAESFYWNNLNKAIANQGKIKLYEALTLGVVQHTIKQETVVTDSGELGTKTTRTVKRLGTPMSAIKMALELINPLEKALESLVAQNAIKPSSLEKVQLTLQQFQADLRTAVSGAENESADLDRVMLAMQNLLIGSSSEDA